MEETEIHLKKSAAGDEVLIVPYTSEEEYNTIKDIADALSWTWPNGKAPHEVYPWAENKTHDALVFIGRTENYPKGLYRSERNKDFCIKYSNHGMTYKQFTEAYGITSEIVMFMAALKNLESKLELSA